MEDAEDIEKTLAQKEAEVIKDKEIDRILNAFKLNPYSILELETGCGENDIKKQYRKKSLLIHPDKTSNEKAPDAFDILKKAQALLMDEKERAKLDEVISDARRILIREKKWSLDDDRLKSDEFKEEWDEKTKELLIEDEFLRRMETKQKLEKEGELKRKREQEAELRRLKKAAREQWEDGRDKRVEGWKLFLKKSKKKKKGGVLV